ncbi:thiamine pyrophosphate-dependent enzyme [Streptomyces sp. NPDC056165]|uniref:thiamine pyrophosphate-dependent enzyme n=1 Tax=Streptomyces sp. NPDC056165 TaxID=3345733 RepID=UPI0035E2AC2F
MELAYPTALCLALALALPEQRVHAVEGDGSMIAGMATLTTVARCAPPNLVVLVINNRSFASTGAQPMAEADAADLVAIARGSGIAEAVRARDVAEVEAALSRAATTPGPHFVVADTEPEEVRTAGSSQAYPFDIVEAAVVFRRALEDRGLVPPSGRLKCDVHALPDDSALPKNPEFSEVIASYCA